MNRKPLLLAAIGGVVLAAIGLWFMVPAPMESPSMQPMGIRPFLADQDLPYIERTFDADSGVVHTLSSGTRITIPAGILVDSAGRVIHGDVTLRIRELDTPQRMLQAGIPMQTLDSTYYRSAGMIEVLAEQDEQPLACAPGSAFDVRLASDRLGEAPDFKLYRLDRAAGATWQEAGAFQPSANLARDSALNALEAERLALEADLPAAPTTSGPDDFVFQLSGHEELARNAKALEGVDWKWVPQPGEDPASPPIDLLRMPWDEVEVTRIRKGLHRFDFSMSYEEEGTTQALTGTVFGESLLKGRAYRQQMQAFESAQAEHEAFYTAYRERQEKLRLERSIFYTFESQGFGLLNIDKLEQESELLLVDVTLTLDGQTWAPHPDDLLWVVAEEANTVFRFTPNQFGRIPLPDGAFSLFLAVGSDEMAHLDSRKTAPARPEPGTASRPPVTFDLERLPASDFASLLSPAPPA